MTAKTVAIFGATGSVGQSAADVIAAHPNRFSVTTVTAHAKTQALAGTARRLNARRAVIADEGQYTALRDALAGSGIEVAAGRAALIDAARESVDLHMAAILGMAGLEPLMAAITRAKSVAIANKEPLVAAGPLVMSAAAQSGCKILPMDSEHNAIFQVLEEGSRDAVEKIILTASGGPFRTASLEDMDAATPERALKHPNWSMGAKISIDSATMMNKALEVIEARYLFDMDPACIAVLIHPQSVIHSMVEYADGSVLAQMGAADMRTPVAYCLGWPERIATPGRRLDWRNLGDLTFEDVDERRFPAIKLAYECLDSGSGACVALNAANEIAVAAYLDKRIPLTHITALARDMAALGAGQGALGGLDDILAFDAEIRAKTESLIQHTLKPGKRA